MTTSKTKPAKKSSDIIVINTEKDALRIIGLIKSGGETMQARIHAVCLFGMDHWYKTGDGTILSEAVRACPKGARINALRYWITANANVVWNNKKYSGLGGWEKGEHSHKKGNKDGRFITLDQANAAPFYEKHDTEQADFNLEKRAGSFMATLKKQAAAGKVSAAELDKAQTEMDALFNELRGTLTTSQAEVTVQ